MMATFVATNGHKSFVTTNVVTNHLWSQMWSPKCVHEYMILLVALASPDGGVPEGGDGTNA